MNVMRMTAQSAPARLICSQGGRSRGIRLETKSMVTCAVTEQPTRTTGCARSGIHSREARGGSGGCDAAPPSSTAHRVASSVNLAQHDVERPDERNDVRDVHALREHVEDAHGREAG